MGSSTPSEVGTENRHAGRAGPDPATDEPAEPARTTERPPVRAGVFHPADSAHCALRSDVRRYRDAIALPARDDARAAFTAPARSGPSTPQRRKIAAIWRAYSSRSAGVAE